MKKTNAVRILESEGVGFGLLYYDFNEEEIDAVSVADKLNLPHDAVFKTLVAEGDRNGIIVFVIPGSSVLDLKKAALTSGNKNVEMIKPGDLYDLTGYIRGGCSPVGMKKKYPVYIEETAQVLEHIYVSAGLRGMQIKISPDNLAKITSASFSNLI